MRGHYRELFFVISFFWLLFGAFIRSEEQTAEQKEEIFTFKLTPPTGDLSPEAYRVESDKLMDYDAQKGIIYGKERTRIYYGKYYLEADRIIVDDHAKEVQAEGNVILRSPVDEVKAEFVRYHLEKHEGYAKGVYGRHGDFFFRAPDKEEKPAFARLSEQESLLREASLTTCDFSTPHYMVRAREFIIYTNERVFARSAVLYLRGIPVFYFPFYTRSLREHSPWSIEIGYSSALGAYTRIGYDYWHSLYEPKPGNEKEMVKRSSGHLAAHVDYFTKRGLGYGLDYKYKFDYGRHHGETLLYAIKDRNRKVEGEEDDSQRWIARIMHRSEILRDLVLVLNIDEFSDSEVYWEFMDPFATEERGRIPERRARAALTWRRDDFVARILVEIKDRISRNRLTNFSDFSDDDLDFDEDPENIYDKDSEGLSRKRFGRVTERYPHLTFSTRPFKISDLPLYYRADLNIINNLDRGLNLISKKDDAFVRGADLYQQISHILRFSPRYTLLSKFGAGIAGFYREDDEYPYKFPSGTVFPARLNNTTFYDEDTLLIGRRKVSLKDVNSFVAYADIEERLSARFTDYLSGFLRYRFRETTNDSLGEYYESIGDRHAKSDIYNFRTREHWLQARLDYYLSRPRINVYLDAWQNLQGKSDIYANERLTKIALGADYKNQAGTFDWNNYVAYERRQIYDPTDPDAFEQGTIRGSSEASYIPKHERWWTKVSASAYKVLDEKDVSHRFITDSGEYLRYESESSFNEQETQINVRGTLGGKIGPKYILEGTLEYDSLYSGIRSAKVVLKRDFHDFVAQLQLRVKRSIFEYEDEDEKRSDQKLEWDVRFNVQFKKPFERQPIGASSIRTLLDAHKEVIAETEL